LKPHPLKNFLNFSACAGSYQKQACYDSFSFTTPQSSTKNHDA
jgi:hypothetical protein